MDLPEYPRAASVTAVGKINRDKERLATSVADFDSRHRTVSDAFVDALDDAETNRANRERIRALAKSKTRGGRAQ